MQAAAASLGKLCDYLWVVGLSDSGQAAGKKEGLEHALPCALCGHGKLVAQLLDVQHDGALDIQNNFSA